MIRPFHLHRPSTIPEVTTLLADLPDAAVYRGGTELLQVMKMGFAQFEHLVDLKGIADLHGISVDPDGSLRIGAATTHRTIERSSSVREAYPALVELERHVANPRVRSVGSIGGNLCFAEPHSDPAAFLLAADARLELTGASGARVLPVSEFILDAMTTALEPGELLVAIVLPPPARGTAVSYRRLAFVERPTASVACRLTIEDGTTREARLVVGSVVDLPVLLADVAALLSGITRSQLSEAVEDVAAAAAAGVDLVDEPGSSAEYRRHLVGVLTRRAVLAAAEEIDGQ
jgi:aerobic carbon-monoxide dehydrogenase medium subunit